MPMPDLKTVFQPLGQGGRRFLVGLTSALVASFAHSGPVMDHGKMVAQAQLACAPFSGRKLTVVVPFKPGGGFDLMARALEPLLATHSGMQVTVSNVTGGTGLLAMRTVVNAKAEKPVVGLIDLGASATVAMEGKGRLALSDLHGLGVMSVDQSVWVTKKAIDWQQASGKPLLVANATNPFLRFGLPSHAMNLKVQAVLGYEGSNEAWLAMLRGDVDAASMSDQSAVRNLATGSDTRVSLVLSGKPDPKFPGVPHLAGPGGMVDTRTQGMSPADRQRLMAIGELAAMLSEQARALVASARLKGEVLTCLRHATEAAIFDPALADMAKRQKFVLNPETAAFAQSRIEKVAQSLKQNDKDLRLIAAQWKKSH